MCLGEFPLEPVNLRLPLRPLDIELESQASEAIVLFYLPHLDASLALSAEYAPAALSPMPLARSPCHLALAQDALHQGLTALQLQVSDHLPIGLLDPQALARCFGFLPLKQPQPEPVDPLRSEGLGPAAGALLLEDGGDAGSAEDGQLARRTLVGLVDQAQADRALEGVVPALHLL